MNSQDKNLAKATNNLGSQKKLQNISGIRRRDVNQKSMDTEAKVRIYMKSGRPIITFVAETRASEMKIP